MDVRETCRQLKPLIGRKADDYYLAYLAEDYRGKQELQVALELLAATILGTDVSEPQVHLSVPPSDVAAGDYGLGTVEYNGKLQHAFGLREDECIQHVAIFGRSGAGKTNTVFTIINAFIDQGKPFLIFDWKRNYRDLLAVRHDEIDVFTVGRAVSPFTFNPLIPPDGTDPATWLKKLIEIIAHSYYLGEGVMFLLQEALHSVYTEFGVYDGQVREYPTLNDVLSWLDEHPVKGRKALWMDSTMRGVKSLCFGHMGGVVNTGVQPNLAALLERNVILELDALTNADKTFIVESLLLWVHHWRLTQPDRETFKHALIIEEAHHILLKSGGASRGGEAVTDTIIREIRELGEAIVLVDQHPSLISIPALGNTYTTVAMNVKHRSDVTALASAMLLEDEGRDLLGRLPVGSAVVKLQGRWLHPFIVRIPKNEIPKGSVTDEALGHIMALRLPPPAEQDREEGGAPPAAPPVALAEDDERFLLNVGRSPLAGSVQRYKDLGVSRRRGNATRQSCIDKGLITSVSINTATGRTVLVELTGKGRDALRHRGHEIPARSRWGGAEHEFWKRRIAERLVEAGWDVVLEQAGEGFTDIVARRAERTIAFEIETGKSDWRSNIQKHLSAGENRLVMLATGSDVLEKIAEYLAAEALTDSVTVMPVQEFAVADLS